MKILLVSPSSGLWKGISRRSFFNGRTFRFSMLSLLTVASLSPQDAKIRIVDEQLDEIPFEESFDVVGITFMTAVAPRAYEIAAEFRKRGVTVVFGGFHTTLNPDEAAQHCDAIVTGSASGAWEPLLEDYRKGCLKRVYAGSDEPSVTRPLPRHLINEADYVTVNATYATLGCTNSCRFCSISAFHQGKRYQRAVQDVIEEISSFNGTFFMFVDDNLTQDRAYAVRLLEELAPLEMKWGTQASIEIAEDKELLSLLQRAGCVGLFIGLETLSEEALRGQEKRFNQPDQYRKAVANVHRYGMFVEAGIIFGFDTDSPDVFKKTLAMLEDIGIDAIQVSLLTPIPGTPLHETMKERIFDTYWGHYDYRHAVFMPKLMKPEDLQAGADLVIRKFYSLTAIAKRLFRWLLMPRGRNNIACPLVLNLAYYGRVKAFGIR